ncbi:hypothetical protein Tco_0979083 [Tanacetum coccineum]
MAALRYRDEHNKVGYLQKPKGSDDYHQILVLLGDLQILMDSPEVNDGSDFWKNQHTWSIQNWKLYSFSGVHVLETDARSSAGDLHGIVGNELSTAVQLIAFLKKQISDSKRPKVHEWYSNSIDSCSKSWTAEVVPKSVAGSSFPAASSTLLPFDVQVQQDF